MLSLLAIDCVANISHLLIHKFGKQIEEQITLEVMIKLNTFLLLMASSYYQNKS